MKVQKKAHRRYCDAPNRQKIPLRETISSCHHESTVAVESLVSYGVILSEALAYNNLPRFFRGGRARSPRTCCSVLPCRAQVAHIARRWQMLERIRPLLPSHPHNIVGHLIHFPLIPRIHFHNLTVRPDQHRPQRMHDLPLVLVVREPEEIRSLANLLR